MKRYIEQFPRAGEVVLFDRSWYHRAMVEPVMGFGTPHQYDLLLKTHIPEVKWHVIRSDDKHKARLNTMRLIMNECRYKGRSRRLEYMPDPEVIIPGNKELRLMQRERCIHGNLMA